MREKTGDRGESRLVLLDKPGNDEHCSVGLCSTGVDLGTSVLDGLGYFEPPFLAEKWE